jgi:membrane fusion protein (multidrug efflux system)
VKNLAPRILPASLLLAPLFASCTAEAGAAAVDETSASAEAAEVQTAEAQEKTLVRVAALAVRAVERSLEATGNVESLDVVEIVSERAEPVLKILAEEGDQVEAGSALARLRSEVAELGVREAEIRVDETLNEQERASRDYERNQALAERTGAGNAGLLSQRDLEISLQAFHTARTSHQSAQVGLEQALLELERCTLRSPIQGTVSRRDLSVGDMAAVGAPAFQVTDLSSPRLVFWRPQRDLPNLRKGQTLQATSEAVPGGPVPGRIERVSPVVDAATGTLKVTVRLEPGDRILPTGILMRARITLERHENALMIPKKALLREGPLPHCFAVRDGIAVRLEIEPGFEEPDHLEVLGGGLVPGDVVVVVGADRLEDGESVEQVQG